MDFKFDIKRTKGQKIAYKMLHNPDVKYMILVWSRQSGKSTFAELACIESLCKQNRFSGYIAPSYKHGQKVFFELMRILESTGIVRKSNASDLRIESIYGSVLQFFSAEAPTSIRGNTISGILIIDEASYFPDILPNGEDIWYNVIQPITKVRCEKIIMISTPAGKRGFFYQHYMRALEGKEGYACMKRTIYDDDLASEEYIEEQKKSIPEKIFAQEYECVFLDSSLTFFEGFENCFGKYQYHQGKEWIGIDLSGNGSDETIITKINELGEICQYKITGTLDMKYAKIADVIDKSNAVAVYMENNGLGAPIINEVKKLVRNKSKIYEWSTTNSSKEEIITNLAVRIANKELFFNDEDVELFSQFGTFLCKISPKTKRFTFEAMAGSHDDRIMSLAIALRCREDFKYAGKPNINFAMTKSKLFI